MDLANSFVTGISSGVTVLGGLLLGGYLLSKRFVNTYGKADTSWTELQFPNGKHATIVYRGHKEKGVCHHEATRQHNEMVEELKGSPIKFTIDTKLSWFGKQNNIGVLKLFPENQEDFSTMFRFFDKYATKDHGPELKMHMTLNSNDNPEDYFGKTISSTVLATALGSRTKLVTNLVKPERKPIMIKDE